MSLITKARAVFLNRKNVSFEFYPLYVAWRFTLGSWSSRCLVTTKNNGYFIEVN